MGRSSSFAQGRLPAPRRAATLPLTMQRVPGALPDRANSLGQQLTPPEILQDGSGEDEWAFSDGEDDDATIVPGSSESTRKPRVLVEQTPTYYFGYLETTKDALLLVEKHLQGTALDPPPTHPQTRGGDIWVQRLPYPTMQGKVRACFENDGRLIVRRWKAENFSEGLIKTLMVHTSSGFYHVIAHEFPEDVLDGKLITPSHDPRLQDMQLRGELALKLTEDMRPSSGSRSPYEIFKADPAVYQAFTADVILIHLSFEDTFFQETIMHRSPGGWFPFLPCDGGHYQLIANTKIFEGFSHVEIKAQMSRLFHRFVELARGDDVSRYLWDQPDEIFSAMQNRMLIGIMFQRNLPCSFALANPLTTSMCLARSAIFYQSVELTARSAENRITHLMQNLSISPQAHGDLSRDLIKILDETPNKDGALIRFISMKLCCDFPTFNKAHNSHSLFLVTCQITSVSSRFEDLLHHWAASYDSYAIYRRLLHLIQGSQPPEELMLHLGALTLLHQKMGGFESGLIPMQEHVKLHHFDQFLRGDSLMSNSDAILRETVWALSLVSMSTISVDRQAPWWSILRPVCDVVEGSINKKSSGALYPYMLDRIQNRTSHATATHKVTSNPFASLSNSFQWLWRPAKVTETFNSTASGSSPVSFHWSWGLEIWGRLRTGFCGGIQELQE